MPPQRIHVNSELQLNEFINARWSVLTWRKTSLTCEDPSIFKYPKGNLLNSRVDIKRNQDIWIRPMWMAVNAVSRLKCVSVNVPLCKLKIPIFRSSDFDDISLRSFPVRPVKIHDWDFIQCWVYFLSVLPSFEMLKAQLIHTCYSVCLVFSLHLCTKTPGIMIFKSKSDSKTVFHTRPGSCSLRISCGLSCRGWFTRITNWQQSSNTVEEILLCKCVWRPGMCCWLYAVYSGPSLWSWLMISCWCLGLRVRVRKVSPI